MERTTPPPDILELMRRAQAGEQLDPGEIQRLQFWASSNAATTDPAWIIGISDVLGSRPETTWGGTDPATLPQEPPQPYTSPITPPKAPPTSTDWVGERDALFPGVMSQTPRPQRDRPAGGEFDVTRQPEFSSGSAFESVDPGYLETVANNPAIAARYMARSRGNENGAGILTEPMSQALALSGMGLLGGRHRDLSALPRSSDERLGRAEALMGSMQENGTFLDPAAIYRKQFRRARKTDVNWMDDGEGAPGGVSDQVNVTVGALLDAATASGLDADNMDWLKAKLGTASQEYVMGVADGTIDPIQQTFPAWLRKEKQAQRWLGR
jgi:hypothetical protein